MYQVELNTLVSSIRNHMYVCMYKCMYVCVGTRVYVLICLMESLLFCLPIRDSQVPDSEAVSEDNGKVCICMYVCMYVCIYGGLFPTSTSIGSSGAIASERISQCGAAR